MNKLSSRQLNTLEFVRKNGQASNREIKEPHASSATPFTSRRRAFSPSVSRTIWRAYWSNLSEHQLVVYGNVTNMKGRRKAVKPLIGFIGQGYIGKNYADDFEKRGFKTVRYALEEPHISNKEKIAGCDIVIIAVPTPTTPKGFDDSIVRKSIALVGKGKIAIIKSTILPGTTRTLQEAYLNIVVLFSPEFLREASARQDVNTPDRNIIGITREEHRPAAEQVMSILPCASHESICTAEEAELVKYAGNVHLYIKVVYMNMLYDLAKKLNVDWDSLAENISADPRIGTSHMHPVHASGHSAKQGRGAGGHCFIKDFAALRELYEKNFGDEAGISVFSALEKKNIDLLKQSGKDLDLLEGVYGKSVLKKRK